MKLKRRDVLKLATAGIALPWLAARNLVQADTGTESKRVLIFVDLYGRHGERTDSPVTTVPWITDEGSDYDLTEEHLGWILNPLARHLDDLSVISGVPMRSRNWLGGGVSHAQVNSYTLTGSRVTGNVRSADTVCAHPSIHNYIGNELNARASTKTVYNSLSLGRNPYTYDDNGLRATSIATPEAIYSTLFGVTDTQSLKAQQIVAEQVRNQIGLIAPELVQANAATVLDAYHASIDTIAKELELRGGLQCGDLTPENVSNDDAGEIGVPQMFDAVYDLFSCGLTSSIALGYDAGRHPWIDATDRIGEDANALLSSRTHHSLSHASTDNAGAAQGVVMQYQIAEIARLADRLKITPELDGSGAMMMDNTVIFYHQAMAAPTHRTNVPYYHFMLSGSNTNVARGRHLECSENSDNELWTTLAQAVGVPATRFGGYQGAVYKGESLNGGPISKLLNETLGA